MRVILCKDTKNSWYRVQLPNVIKHKNRQGFPVCRNSLSVIYNFDGRFSAPCVHGFVIFLVISGGDVVHPFLIVEVPAYGFLNTLLKL